MMTSLDEIIAKIQSDEEAHDLMGDLLDTLIAAREDMQDPTDEEEAQAIVEDIVEKYLLGTLGNLAEIVGDGEVDEEYMKETANAVEEAFKSEGWEISSKHNRRNDFLQYELKFNVSNTTLVVIVSVEDDPKRIRIQATLPIIGDNTYAYLLSKAIVDANKRFVYGAFQYDQDDGELTYEYSYPINHGFYKDDLIRIIRVVIHTALDDDAYTAIRKAALGRYKRAEREEILKKLALLEEDLED